MMIMFTGKSKDYNFKLLLWAAFWQLARPIEQLESCDFSVN